MAVSNWEELEYFFFKNKFHHQRHLFLNDERNMSKFYRRVDHIHQVIDLYISLQYLCHISDSELKQLKEVSKLELRLN